jgi:hypothetical protein
MENHFSVRKMVQDESFFSRFGKWFEIYDGLAFSSLENGPD